MIDTVTQNTTITKFEDWATLYGKIDKSVDLPGKANLVTDPQPSIRRMFVDIAVALTELESKNPQWQLLTIYADVVRLPKEYRWFLEGRSVIIVARRVEALEETGIFLKRPDKKPAALVVYADECVGLKIVVALNLSKNQPWSQQINQMTALGFKISFDGEKIYKQDLDSLPFAMFRVESELYRHMVISFQYATILYEQRQNIARLMLAWIKRNTINWVEMQEMFIQSSALLSNLENSANGISFVPYLSRSLYQRLSESFTRAAESFEQEYDNFCNVNRILEDRKEAAKLMLNYFSDTSDFSEKLIQQSNDNLNNAKQALNANFNRISTHKKKLEEVKKAFEKGLGEWKAEKDEEIERQKAEAGLQIAGAIIGFIGSVVTIVVGAVGTAIGGAGAPVAAAGVAGAATSLAAIGGTVAGAATAAAQITKIVEAAKALGQVIDLLNKTMEAIQNILEAVEQLKSVGGLQDDLLKRINELTSSLDKMSQQSDDASWSVFEEEIDVSLKIPINEGISGASEYRKELRLLGIYGKALNSSQRAVIELTQQLVRLELEKEVSRKQVNRITEYVNSLSERQLPNADMAQLFYQRYLNVKRWLFVAIENHNAAYNYWAMREPSFTPSILKRVSELKKDLADIERDYVTALDTFNPPPQPFSGKSAIISDSDTLKTFKQTKELILTIPLAHPEFLSWNRVRVTTVRVWIHGANHQESNAIYVVISTSGHYYDRYQGKNYEFTAAPLQRAFQYRNQPIKEQGVIVDGKVADEQKYAYFEPTPFTTWVISLPEDQNQGIDLTGVYQITLEFTGSAIAPRKI